jgi:hypothetical protein
MGSEKRRDVPRIWVALVFLAVCGLGLGLSVTAEAGVREIVIDDRRPLAPVAGQTIPYEQISGRAFGELDPKHPLNRMIQDIELSTDSDGKVRYVASFVLTKPVDMNDTTGFMYHVVPNRGGPSATPLGRRNGDISLASGWQGDNSGRTAVRSTMLVGGRHFLQLPVALNPDGSTITGEVLGRIVNRSGPASQPLIVYTSPVPYRPLTLDTTQATLVTRAGETATGGVTGETPVPSTDWAWARCNVGGAPPFPGTPDPTQICVRGGFDPAKLYQVVFTARDPYPLGVGYAAFRDVGHFFKSAVVDDSFTPNPVALGVSHSMTFGSSQSGGFLRAWLHLGFNQAEDGTQVHDGLWSMIAVRRTALNHRWAQPDGPGEPYQVGLEGPMWWHSFPDHVRGVRPAGILDRCRRSKTCPKIFEHAGSAEMWTGRLTAQWVGTGAKNDIPLPENVRRYYIAGSTHGGGPGGFDSSLPGTLVPGPACLGNNPGIGLLPDNPVPHLQIMSALRERFRSWIMFDVPPPDSVYPMLNGRGKNMPDLVEATKEAMGFPTIPGLPAFVLGGDFVLPVLDYDWGPYFDPTDLSGVPTNALPPIKQAIKVLVPRVDADGNEIGGIPNVLTNAPLGTYLGWNIVAGGFHQGKSCFLSGGMIPFARTRAERMASGDPRLSLEERYGTHAGYVAAVSAAAANAVTQGFLLQTDAAALIAQADASQVLR